MLIITQTCYKQIYLPKLKKKKEDDTDWKLSYSNVSIIIKCWMRSLASGKFSGKGLLCKIYMAQYFKHLVLNI